MIPAKYFLIRNLKIFSRSLVWCLSQAVWLQLQHSFKVLLRSTALLILLSIAFSPPTLANCYGTPHHHPKIFDIITRLKIFQSVLQTVAVFAAGSIRWSYKLGSNKFFTANNKFIRQLATQEQSEMSCNHKTFLPCQTY